MNCNSGFVRPMLTAYLKSKGIDNPPFGFPDAYALLKQIANLDNSADNLKHNNQCAAVILWLRGGKETNAAWDIAVKSAPDFAKKLRIETMNFRRARNERREANKLPIASGRFSKRFYRSQEWLSLRYATLRKYHGRCVVCGRSAKDGVRLEVDHIKPKSVFPELALDPNNLQVMCYDCNHGKSNTCTYDWAAIIQGCKE